jgi:hypothetical protein
VRRPRSLRQQTALTEPTARAGLARVVISMYMPLFKVYDAIK